MKERPKEREESEEEGKEVEEKSENGIQKWSEVKKRKLIIHTGPLAERR